MTDYAPKLVPYFAGPGVQAAIAKRLLEAERLELALQFTERALDENPELAEAHFLRGGVLAAKGRWDDDASQLQLSMRLDPRSSAAWLKLAWDRARARKPGGRRAHIGQALSEYKAAALLAPTDMSISLKLAQFYREEGRNNMALQSLRMASVFHPKDAECCELIARIYLDETRYLEAVEFAERALSLDPDHSGAKEVKRLATARDSTETSSTTEV